MFSNHAEKPTTNIPDSTHENCLQQILLQNLQLPIQQFRLGTDNKENSPFPGQLQWISQCWPADNSSRLMLSNHLLNSEHTTFGMIIHRTCIYRDIMNNFLSTRSLLISSKACASLYRKPSCSNWTILMRWRAASSLTTKLLAADLRPTTSLTDLSLGWTN